MNMIKFCGAVFALALVAMPVAAAPPTLIGTPSDITAVQGLVVNGVSYDVTFVFAPFLSVYKNSTPLFAGNEPLGGAAAIALAKLFKKNKITGVAGSPRPHNIDRSVEFNVPLSGQLPPKTKCPKGPPCYRLIESYYDPKLYNWPLPDPGFPTDIGTHTTYGHNVIAVFSVSP